jgi:uncharacterized protein YodC (DUF2158 family)
MEHYLEVGDAVKWKSGGPTMTVTALGDGEITCGWFDTLWIFHEEDFLTFGLIKIEGFVTP